ncbi:MAG: hypothetical protein RLZZ58_1962 [Pseudomonadota bacterium]
MSELRQRLAARLRRAERQRLALIDQAEKARSAFSPPALKSRARTHAIGQVKQADRAARAAINDYRLPIVAAALGGLAIALQQPVRHYGPGLLRRLKALAEPTRSDSEPVDVERKDENVEDTPDGQTD